MKVLFKINRDNIQEKFHCILFMQKQETHKSAKANLGYLSPKVNEIFFFFFLIN